MHNFFYVFIPIRYMFRAAMCPSSGELIVSMRHLFYITLCRWPSGMQVGDLHTRRSLLYYVLLTVHLSIMFVNKPTWCTLFSYMFISILYMFRQPCAHHQQN